MKKIEVQRDMAVLFRLMRLIALWPYDYDQHLPKWLKGRYRISMLLNLLYYLFWQFICLHIAIFHIKTVLDSLDNFNDLFLVMVTTLIYWLMFVLNAYFQLYFNKNMILIEMMSANFRRRSAAGITYVTYDSCRRFVIRFFKIWIVTCVLGTMHWAFFPILQREKILPLQCWYPFDVRRSPMYELAYLGQVLGQLQVGLVFGMVGSILMMYIFMVCGQFDILCCSLSNVYNTAMINNGNYQCKLSGLQILRKSAPYDPQHYYIDEVFMEDLSNTTKSVTKQFSPLPKKHGYLVKLSNELATALDDCVDHHAMLFEFCHLLEECYHPFIMLTLGQIVGLQCMLAYMATVDSLSPMKLMNILEYFAITMIELFSLCYLGQTLKNQSTKVGDALMTSPWYECGADFRQRTQMILINSVKPIKVTALKLFDLDFETYFAVLKASFSYYTLLKKLQQ